MSHLKNFAVSASRGSTVVFIFGVVVALVGAMMLFAPAGLAQETSEAAEVSVAEDEEYDVDALTEEIQSVEKAIEEAPAPGEDASEASEASEFVEEPVVSKDPVSVERDGDIDTVTIDDTDFTAWHDSETGLEKVSDDALYGISRESDAKIDEIVEVEADGDVVDEDAYGFIYDDEDKLDKIVIDYYGLKTTPPETLTLKVKSSEEGEYSILDEDEIPAKADVQDAGFLPDPSAEEQEKIDKAKKENRAANPDTHQLTLGEVSVKSDASTKVKLSAEIAGDVVREQTFLNKVVIRDNRDNPSTGLDEKAITFRKNGSTTELCKFNNPSSDPAVKVVDRADNGKANQVEIDLSGCTKDDSNTKKKFVDFWEGVGNTIDIDFGAAPNSKAEDFDVYFWGSRNLGEDAGKVAYPKGIPDPDEWTEKVDNGTLTTKTEALETRGDFKVTMTREFDKGGDIASDVTAQVEHINGAFLDNNVMSPKLKVLNADGSVIKELQGKAGEDVDVKDDLSDNKWGGVAFSQDVEGITVPNGGKIVVEMGFRKKSGAPVDDDLNMQPLGPGELNVDLASSDEHFELKTVGDIDATSRVISRDDPYEDHIKIASRSKFKGATVTVYAPGNILQPWKASNYSFDILSDAEGKTGIQDGYGLKANLKSIDGNRVVYEVYPVKDNKRVSSALIEAGTSIAVKSAFSGKPSKVETTVELEGEKIAKAADKTWAYGLGEIKKYPVGAVAGRTISGQYALTRYGFNGASAPFALEKPNHRGVYTFGGVCLQPFLGVPGIDNVTLNPNDWNHYPADYSPAGGEIPVQNQKALSYLVNQLYFEGVTEREAVRRTEQKMMEIAAQAGFQGLSKEYAFAAVYGAILTLAGWDYDSLQKAFAELSPAVYEGRKTTMQRGRVIADWILNNVNLDAVEINYQILQPKGTEAATDMPWQTIIVPGGGGSSAMSTVASLEEENFSDYRVSKSPSNQVSTVYDRVEYRGLKPDTYVLKTELRRVLNEDSDETSVIYSTEKELNVSSEDAAHVDIAINRADFKDDLNPGRYVFFETIVDSAGKVVVKHTDAGDKAQSFWIEEPTEEVPSSAGFQLRKVAADDKHLVSGAEFTVADSANLSKASFVKKMDSLDEANENGANYTVDGLKTGKDYWVFETKAPSGEGEAGKNYQLLAEPLRFMLTDEGLKFWDKNVAPSGDYTFGQTFPVLDSKVKGDKGSVIGVATVANVWIGDLPKTGGNGIAPWLLLGGLIMAAGALMGNRRRA